MIHQRNDKKHKPGFFCDCNCSICETKRQGVSTSSCDVAPEVSGTEDKGHKCKHCARWFDCVSKYMRHERTHTGEKPFQCRFCGKYYRTSDYCKVHERIHTGEKPFQCGFCPKRFTTSGGCKSHEGVHMKDK